MTLARQIPLKSHQHIITDLHEVKCIGKLKISPCMFLWRREKNLVSNNLYVPWSLQKCGFISIIKRCTNLIERMLKRVQCWNFFSSNLTGWLNRLLAGGIIVRIVVESWMWYELIMLWRFCYKWKPISWRRIIIFLAPFSSLLNKTRRMVSVFESRYLDIFALRWDFKLCFYSFFYFSFRIQHLYFSLCRSVELNVPNRSQKNTIISFAR